MKMPPVREYASSLLRRIGVEWNPALDFSYTLNLVLWNIRIENTNSGRLYRGKKGVMFQIS